MNASNADIQTTELYSLLSDSRFIALNAHLNSFNPFEVLKLKGHEIRHSNMLAWLFSTQESHGLRSLFLEQFLLSLGTANKGKVLANSTRSIDSLIAKLLGTKSISTKVFRERKVGKKSIDILIECVVDSNDGFIILIENKTFSKQHDDQLSVYLEGIKAEQQKMPILPIFLTVDENDEPENGAYFRATYAGIHAILENILCREYATKCKSPQIEFIKYYKETLEEVLGMREEQVLARELYKQYKKVIDFISENGDSDMVLAGTRFLKEYNAKKDGKIELVDLETSNSRFFRFSDEVLEATNDGEESDWRKGTDCAYFFELLKNQDDIGGRLCFSIEVGPFKKEAERSRFLQALKDEGFKVGSSPKYTRITMSGAKENKSKTVDDITNQDELFSAMHEVFKSNEHSILRLRECVNKFTSQQKQEEEK